MVTFLIEGSYDGELWLTIDFELEFDKALVRFEEIKEEHKDKKVRLRHSDMSAG